MSAFINEFHYDNLGGDLGEFIEIAAPGGFDLTGWSIVLYNGSNGSSYGTIDLTGLTVVDSAGGFGFVTVDVAGLQNGSPDGMALVDNTGGVIEFLSYEGQLTAIDGPANGMTSTDVVVAEGNATPVGQSLQRQGVWDGSAADFAFAGPLDETRGAVNEGQFFGDVTPDIPSLVITEFLADPDASDALGDANGDGVRSATQDEFVEIVNTGSDEVDLSGITISDGIDVRHIFADGTTLAAGAAIVVFGGGTPTGEFGGSQVVTASTGTLGLNNGGDTITIATADADIITSLDYGSEGGQNVSLTRDPDLTGDFVGHDNATGSGGAVFSPGTLNDGSAFVLPDLTPVLAINEVHADPAADNTGDANGDGERSATADEFVEIVNTGTVEADLSGVTISDGISARHTFAEGTTLAVGAAIVVFGGGIPTGGFGGAQVVTASTGSLGLNNGGDTVTLATASGDLIDQMTYGGEGANNQSLTRAPDLTGDFVQHTDVTGADGALFSPGTSANGAAFGGAPNFVINEVDADTQGTDTAEFIEIFDGGFGNQSLDGVFLALFNGGADGDAAYDTIDLTGHTTDENGYFVVGSADVPNVDLEAFTSNGLQNGADAVALYTGVPADLIDGLPTTTNLLDAIVYDTNDTDDSALLDALGLTEQYNEDENGQKDTQSNSRVPDGTGDFVAQASTPGEANEADVAPPEPELRLISEIQGSSGAVTKVGLDDRSAFEGETVTVDAIVTANFLTGGLSGFFLQEEDFDADADANSSEGIFISVSGTLLDGLDVSLGDQVSVTGTVQENFGQTQIAAINVSVISSNNASPTATFVQLGELGAIQDDDSGIDYVANLEAYEGMLVTFENSLTITELFNLDRFGEYRVSADGRPTQFTQTNDPDAAGLDAHLQDVAANSILLDDGLTEQNPFEIQILDDDNGVLDSNDAFRMGDTLDNVTGVVAYSFDEFRIHDATGDYTETNERPETPEDVGGSFKVASMNILNYFVTLDTTSGSFNGPNTSGPNNDIEPRGANTVEELDRQADKIIDAIIQMDADVLGLVELENDDDDAISDLVTRLNAELGAEVYDFVATGDVGTDAITNGIIYKIASAIPVGDVAILTEFNGESFVDPLDTGADRNRPSVAQTFQDVSTGELITVAVNHFKSKGSGTGAAEDEDMSDGAGSSNATRTEGATILADWLASDPTDTGAVKQLIVGDLNAYAMEDPLDVLAAAGFTDLAAAALGEDAYSFVFDGQIGTLDYILANEAVVDDVTGVTEWHINSDEADAIDYNIQVLEFGDGTIVTRDPAIYDGETAARHSDHDPLLIGLSLTPVEPEFNLVMGTEGRDNLVGTDGDDIIHSLAGSYDRMTGGDGADVFVFGDETTNGIRERDVIMDYEVGIDSIVLEAGTNVASIRETSSQVVVFLDGDQDAIYIRGDGLSADNITIFTDDLFQFV